MLEERGDGLTDTGSIDDDTATVPDIFQEINELRVEFGMALSSPLIVFDNTDDGLAVFGGCGDG